VVDCFLDGFEEVKLPSRSFLRWTAAVAAGLLAVLVAAAIAFLPSDASIRRRVERTLSERLNADVKLAELHVSLLPGPRVDGAGLQVTARNRRPGPPLLAVSRFTARASWMDVFRRPRRVEALHVEGLRVTISPRLDATGIREREGGGCGSERRRTGSGQDRGRSSPVLVAHLTAPNAEVVLLPRDERKLPRRFAIASLDARDISLDRPFDFDAVLTNPTPTGLITTHGRFGPWAADDPGLTPLEGRYQFDRANLDAIKGIGGILTSTGRFAGALQQIVVSGTTDTPDFSLDTGRHPLPLHTTFEACVDGTDGDTYLDRVQAQLAATPIAVTGKVEGRVGVSGRLLQFDASIERGRIEDLLRLAVPGDEPMMKGDTSLSTKVVIPPGDGPVSARLRLQGEFNVAGARFTERSIQQKIDEFSRRGQGRPEDMTVRDVASNLAGRFTLESRVLRLQPVAFAMPGALVRLLGRYGVADEQLDFEGTVRLKAKVSETTHGIKSTLLKAVDALFKRKNAGTVLPIEITGTRAHPKIGVDVKKVLTRKAK
jgi:hypothetical protein